MLLDEESEHASVYHNEEKNEFLFKLFKHFCIGGELCQHEDYVEPYINMSRNIYKDLIKYFSYYIFN